MKIQMIVHIKNDDGTIGAESTAIEVDVPNYEAFTGPEQFGEVFDQYERKVLEARNAVIESATGSREHYKTACFRELVVFFPCDETFRRSADKINRVLWRLEKADQVRSRTIANLVEREGESIQEQIKEKAERILTCNGFSTDGKLTDVENTFEPIAEDALLPHAMVCKMIEELNEENIKERHIIFSELHETFEDPHAVRANISLDDVCCKK